MTYQVKMNTAVMQYRRGQIGIGGLLLVFIAVLIGVALAGPLGNMVTNPVNQTGASMENYTGGAGALAQQIPMFYIILIVGMIVTPIALEFAKMDR